MSTYRVNNIRYTGNLISPGTDKGTVLANNGTTFEKITPTVNNQLIYADASSSSGLRFSEGPQGLGAGFGIPNGITPTAGNTSYFLVEGEINFVPAIAILAGTISLFSVRPGNVNGWTNSPNTISGGTIDYTMGYIGSTQQPIIANFTPYPGGPHFQVNGTDINTNAENFASYVVDLSIPVSQGDQICIRITNNLTFSGSQPTSYTDQNASLLLRF